MTGSCEDLPRPIHAASKAALNGSESLGEGGKLGSQSFRKRDDPAAHLNKPLLTTREST